MITSANSQSSRKHNIQDPMMQVRSIVIYSNTEARWL
jgi:hypothetical protein